jgi:hypothetical protein
MIKHFAIVSLAFYLMALPAEAAKSKIAEHVYFIDISQGWDYGYPEDELFYEFTFSVHTDISVDSVQFLTPEGNTFSLDIVSTESGGTVYWEYHAEYTDVGSLAVYGDGTYTITVFYEGNGQNQTTAWFGIPRTNDSIPQPIQEPVLIFPVNEGTTTSPVTFEWEPSVDTDTNLIVLNLENTTTDERTMKWFRPTKTEWRKARLSTGTWEADLSFGQRYNPSKNNDGIPVRVSKYSTSDWVFGVNTD